MKYKTTCIAILLASIIVCAKFGGEANAQPSFAATGLLTHPAESAEEILVRAHNMDLDAIVLTVAGYSLGVGGFPEIYAVGSAWAGVSARVAAPEDVALLVTINDLWRDDAKHGPSLLADCDLAQKSAYAKPLEEAGVFDLSARRAELSSLRGESGEWLKAYQARQAQLTQQTEYFAQMRVFVAELAKRPATEKELLRLKDYITKRFSALIYFSGTDPAAGGKRSAWSAARSLEFVGRRFGDPDSGRGTVATNLTFWYALGDSFSDNSALVRDLIHRAHVGDMDARRAMTQYYIAWGSPGNYLVLEPDLAIAWMFANNKLKDEKAYLQMAVYTYQGKDLAVSWALASLAKDAAKGEERELAEVLLRLLEADPHFDRAQAEKDRQKYFNYFVE